MNRLIPIVYRGSSYRFEVSEDLYVVGLSVVRGKKCTVPQHIDLADVPYQVDDLLFEELLKLHNE